MVVRVKREDVDIPGYEKEVLQFIAELDELVSKLEKHA